MVYRARAGSRQKIPIAENAAYHLAISEGDAAEPTSNRGCALSAVASRHAGRRMLLCSLATAGGDAVYTATAMNEDAGAIHDGL